jgi:hypothetical protein
MPGRNGDGKCVGQGGRGCVCVCVAGQGGRVCVCVWRGRGARGVLLCLAVLRPRWIVLCKLQRQFTAGFQPNRFLYLP